MSDFDLRHAAELADMLSTRRAKDGLAAVELFDHQASFVESEKDEAWLFGANRSGKSEALAVVVASMLRFGRLDPAQAFSTTDTLAAFRPVRVWIVSLTGDMSRNIIQPKLFNNGARIDPRPPLIPDDEIASWNITTQTLTLKNGSIGIFKSVEQGRDAFQGGDVEMVAYDEVPDEWVYREGAIRIGGGRKLYIRGAATILPPAGVPGGVSWMYMAKAKPWLALGATTAERNQRSRHLDIFTAGIRANKSILEEEVDKLSSTFKPGSPEYLIRVEGMLMPSIGGALCYPHFNDSYHVVENPIVPYLPLCLCVDFNPENGVWIVGQRVNGVFKIIDEITMERSDIASMTYEFRGRFPSHQAELWIYGDATGRRKEGQTGMSSFHLIQQYMIGYPVPIRFKLPDLNPGVRDRVDAVNLQMNPPDGRRCFEVAARCENVRKDCEGTKWNALGKIDKRNGRRSDGMDSAGYWIAFECPVVRHGMTTAIVRSVKSPAYLKSGAFPHAGVSNRPVRIGNRWYGRRVHV
jgi:phage terminase large subunit-like protein